MEYLNKLFILVWAITFFTSGAIISVLQLVLYIVVKPFNVDLFRKINYYLCYGLFIQLGFLYIWWSDSELIIYADKDDYQKYFGKEHALCISNHTYEIDWLIIPMLGEPFKILGNYKCYAKKALKFAPVLGWVLSLSENVFLERNFEKDKENIQRQVALLSSYKEPMWLIMFPEGTRFTPSKHKVSMEYSKKHDLEQLTHHLQPRTRGFITSLPPMKGKITSVYDILVAFKTDEPNQYQPTLRNMLNGKRMNSYVYVNRIPTDSIPDTEKDQDKFLRDLFITKDKMKDSFLKTGDFFETSGVQRFEPFKYEKRFYTLLWPFFWFLTILCPIAYLIIVNLLAGNFMYSCISIGFLILIYILLLGAIGISEISKSSSYGTKT